MRVKDFVPSRDIPDLSGKVIVLTGGTGGIGRQTVIELSRHNPAHIVFTGRNASAAEQTIAACTAAAGAAAAPGVVSFQRMNQASLAEVAVAARDILAQHPRIDLLICNGAIMIEPPALSADGYEEQWAVNYLAHALVLGILLPALEQAPAPRVVLTSSKGQSIASAFDFAAVRPESVTALGSATFAPMKRYSQSKLALLVHAQELARRHPRIRAVSVHPGVVRTDPLAGKPLWLRWTTHLSAMVTGGMLEPEQGAYNTLWAATAPEEDVESGAYYEPVAERGKVNSVATPEAGEALWRHAEEAIAPFVGGRSGAQMAGTT